MWLGVLILLIGMVYYVLQRSRLRNRELEMLPEVNALPLIGNVHQFIGGPQRIMRSIWRFGNGVDERGGIGKAWLGTKPYVVITKPEDAQIVLENCLHKEAVYRFLRPWLGNGLFIAPYELWKVHRRVLLPVFQNRIIGEYVDVVGEQGDVLVERLATRCGLQIDVFKYITACTLDIVFHTAMGERMDVQRSPESSYLHARNTVMSIINMRIFKVWLQPDWLFNLTPYAKQQKDNIEITHAFADEVIKRKRKQHESEDQKDSGGIKVLLDLLFERDMKFTDEQLREHIDSITIAGNDTTALVISYTLVLLGVHPTVQQQTYDELQRIFGNSRRTPTKEDMQRMVYLERVIKEAMRLYTVVPVIARIAERDVKLSTCTIPAGTGCVIAACSLHRSRAVWGEDADEFDPDRFLPERSQNRHPCAYIPFSHGARNCIGRHFGMLVMKSVIATMLRSFHITAPPIPIDRLKIEIILFPIDGHLLTLEKRQDLGRTPIRPTNS